MSPPSRAAGSFALQMGIDIGGSSVKVAALKGAGLATARAGAYDRPSVPELVQTVREALDQLGVDTRPERVGVCVPGQFEADGVRVKHAVNLPALNGLDPRDVLADLGINAADVRVLPDALASALGSFRVEPVAGTLLCICLGTGVGASLLRDGAPVTLDGASAGHFGQLDVSLTDDAPVGPDGGRGSLEAYIGLRALKSRFADATGAQLEHAIGGLGCSDPELRALARALRIAHAIYKPEHVRLLGGVGAALAPCLPELRSLVEDQLTSVASPDWTLDASDDPFLAAIGAASVVGREPS